MKPGLNGALKVKGENCHDVMNETLKDSTGIKTNAFVLEVSYQKNSF